MYITEFFDQLAALATFTHFGVLVSAVLLGILFGAVPGLTATLGVALLTAVTFNLTASTDPRLALEYSMTALVGIYVGAIYGGCHPAVLLNLAQSSAKANHPLEAAKYFNQFLREATTATPQQRKDAEAAGWEIAIDGMEVTL